MDGMREQDLANQQAEADTTGAAASKAPEPKHGAGVHVLRYHLDHNGHDVATVAHILNSFPADQHEMFRMLHARYGNGYVQAVVTAMKPPAEKTEKADKPAPQPELPAPPVIDAMPAMPAALPTALPELPPPPAPTLAAQPAPPAEVAASAAQAPGTPSGHAPPEAVVTPEVFAKYVAAARMFLVRRFKLTEAQGAALQFGEGPVIGGALNLEVNGLPDIIIPKPEGTRSAIETDYNDNFYTNLPKDIRPPGKGRVAHIMCNDAPVPDQPGMVKISGTIRMHFDIGNPEDVVGIMKHVFGDLMFGQLNQKAQEKEGKVTPIK
ncbi:MAG TPA: hypothetical protein VLX92_17230 [Kofleriaceae bacterium]|nr:hypothetical protein [Kofleriaceae bacterium]